MPGQIRYARGVELYGPLHNYIQMHRRRVGLSQAELSLLISVEQRASLSRYEQGRRLPNLETALALEMVLGQRIQELYAGVSVRVRDGVTRLSRQLLESLDDTPTRETALKFELLSKLAHPDDERIIPIWEDEA